MGSYGYSPASFIVDVDLPALDLLNLHTCHTFQDPTMRPGMPFVVRRLKEMANNEQVGGIGISVDG